MWNCCNNGQTCITGPYGGYCQNPNRNVHCGNGKGGTPEYCATADKCCQVTLYPPVWHCCDYYQTCTAGPHGSICSNYNNISQCGNRPDGKPEYCGRAAKCCQVSKSPSVWNCCNSGQTCTAGPYGGKCTNVIMNENINCGNGLHGPAFCDTANQCCQVSKNPSVWHCCNKGQVCITDTYGGKCSNVATKLKTAAKIVTFYAILFLFVPYFYIC